MTIIYYALDLKDFDVVPGVNPPTANNDYSADNGVAVTSAVPLPSVVFPDNVLSAAYWTFTTLSTIGATPALSVAIDWYLVTPSSTAANVRWGAAVAVTPMAGTTVNSQAAPLATAVVANGAIVTSSLTDPTTFFKPARTTVALTNGGGNFVAANGPALVTLKVFRDGADFTLDTAVGAVKVRQITVFYQDT